MIYEFDEAAFTGGRFAVVRDLNGTRAALRHIPRGHRVAIIGAITVDSSGNFHPVVAGESDVILGDEHAGPFLSAWQDLATQVMNANGYSVNGTIVGPFGPGFCPIHGSHG